MKPQQNYKIYNPFEHARVITPSRIKEMNQSIDHQLELVNKKDFHIYNCGFNCDHLEIGFCIKNYQNSEFCLNWDVKVKPQILIDWVKENCQLVNTEYCVIAERDYEVVVSPEDYFEENQYEVCLLWLKEQDLETLDYI